MAVHFRKSKKVAPGTRVNFGKKSAGVSFGNRGGGISFNSKRGVRVRASIPGTGVSFSGKLFGKKKRKSTNKKGSLGGRILTGIIFISVLSYLLPVLIPVFVIGFIVLFAFAYRSAKKEHETSEKGVPPTGQPTTVTYEEAIRESVLREIEIMNDCIELVNSSCNFSTVTFRYSLLIETLTKLSWHTDQELRIAGVSPERPFKETLEAIQSQKDMIINQAIKRAYDRTVEDAKALKTEKGRQNRLAKFKASILASATVSQANVSYLNSLFGEKGVV